MKYNVLIVKGLCIGRVCIATRVSDSVSVFGNSVSVIFWEKFEFFGFFGFYDFYVKMP